MPEPAEQGDQGSQVEQIANTPQASADQPTIAKQSDKAPSFPGVMDFLDIPPELQERLAPKAEAAETETLPESPPTELPEPEPETVETPVDGEGEEEEEEEDEPTAAAQEQQPKVDKRQKRINRLTRQKNDLERQVDHIISENQKLRQQLEKGRPPEDFENKVAPLVGGNLPVIDKEIAICDAKLTWCDNNAEGGEIGEGDKAQYYDAKEIRSWRREAELQRQKLVVAQQRELERLAYVRQEADQQAIALWPEMFDKSTPEYQEAVSIIRKYPFITSIPEANYALGLFIEAGRSMKARAAAAKNGEPQKKHRDIDERVFTTPRVPIAPHTSEPLSREAAPSLTKRYNEAMSKLINDPDGGAGNVAAVFAAQEATAKTQPAGRTQVRT
jgi:hypothetical protein